MEIDPKEEVLYRIRLAEEHLQTAEKKIHHRRLGRRGTVIPARSRKRGQSRNLPLPHPKLDPRPIRRTRTNNKPTPSKHQRPRPQTRRNSKRTSTRTRKNKLLTTSPKNNPSTAIQQRRRRTSTPSSPRSHKQSKTHPNPPRIPHLNQKQTYLARTWRTQFSRNPLTR